MLMNCLLSKIIRYFRKVNKIPQKNRAGSQKNRRIHLIAGFVFISGTIKNIPLKEYTVNQPSLYVMI